jgi:dihydrolipoamide dehydrogenase
VDRQVDVAILGAGTAGLNARREAEKAGRSWVLIDGGPLGTTCARVGCMPSKLLIAAAEAAHHARRASAFGVQVDAAGVRVDGAAVLRRVREERDRFAGFVVDGVEKLPPEQVLRGHAHFVAPGTLEVEGHGTVKAKAVVIATGSRPWLPAPFDAIPLQVLTSDDLFELPRLPDAVAVIGTGIIGLELGQALHRLDVETTFFNPFDELGLFTDPAVDRAARRILGEELDLRLGTAVESAEPAEAGVRLTWRTPEGTTDSRTFPAVLVAAGRRPSIRGLRLEAAGVAVDEKGRPAWSPETTQVGDLPIFIAGDASGHRPLLHEASDEGRIAGRNAASWPDVRTAQRRLGLAIAFTSPQMAVVGKKYAELEPDEICVGEIDFANQGRARVILENAGLVRLYADRKTCQLVGAEMFGPRVEHMAHAIAWIVQSGLRAQDALSLPFYHPVLEEGLRTALRSLVEGLKVAGGCPPEDFAESPGA